jgi:xanthine/uracil/vitamin C permease (AzgA family)
VARGTTTVGVVPVAARRLRIIMGGRDVITQCAQKSHAQLSQNSLTKKMGLKIMTPPSMAELKSMMTWENLTDFKVKERGSSFTTEIRAGITTFLTMSYILAVNAQILSDSGGPCYCDELTYVNETGDEVFAESGCMFGGPGLDAYNECKLDVQRQLITATAVSSFLACMMMGMFANLPFALAPGMGLNAYFTYDVVGFKGSGDVKWNTAMTAIFIEGFIFLFLTVTGR